MPTRRRILSAFLVLVAPLSSSPVAAQTRNWDGIAQLCKGRNLRACVDEQVMLMDLASFSTAALARNVHAPSSLGDPHNVNGRWMLSGWEFAQILHQDVGRSAPTTFDDNPLTTFDGNPSPGTTPAGASSVFHDFIAPAYDLTDNTGNASASAASVSIASLETTIAPEPGTIVLLGTGVAGLIGWRRRRDRATIH